jgi:hypothetical protein
MCLAGTAEAGLTLSGWRGQRIHNDRVGASRNDDRQAGKGTASPTIGSIVDDAEDGYANDSPMETTTRFPRGCGNLAKNARFPHSPNPGWIRRRRRNSLPSRWIQVSVRTLTM